MAGEPELLVNVKNHQRTERDLDPALLAVRAEGLLASEEQARYEALRAAAVERLRERAQYDEAIADLLLVLGL